MYYFHEHLFWFGILCEIVNILFQVSLGGCFVSCKALSTSFFMVGEFFPAFSQSIFPIPRAPVVSDCIVSTTKPLSTTACDVDRTWQDEALLETVIIKIIQPCDLRHRTWEGKHRMLGLTGQESYRTQDTPPPPMKPERKMLPISQRNPNQKRC